MEQLTEARSDSKNENNLEKLDKIRLINLMPEEIWQHVTTRLPKRQQNQNLEHLSNSSVIFRNLFDSQKTKFLFGKVLNVLIKNNYIQNLTDVLNCRSVCKVWNNEVDKILSQEKCKLVSRNNLNVLDSNEKLLKFLVHFEDTHFNSQNSGRSPFIGTRVSLKIKDDFVPLVTIARMICRRKLYLISKIMKRYGSHIKTIIISFCSTDYQVLENGLDKIKDWIFQMENLVELRVLNRIPNLTSNFKTNFLIQSFPHFSKPEVVYVKNCKPYDLSVYLFKNSSQIRKLTAETRTKFCSSYDDYQTANSPVLPNLAELNIDMNWIGKIGYLRNNNFPYLSTLTLVPYRNCKLYEKTRWPEIFSVLEKEFGGTLERLSVEFKSQVGQDLSDTSSCQLNLPKLKEIRLIVNETTVNLDFMWPMKDSLERICVMIIENGNAEGALVKMMPFHHIWIKNVREFPGFSHFDTTHDEIKNRINESIFKSLGKRESMGDFIILR